MCKHKNECNRNDVLYTRSSHVIKNVVQCSYLFKKKIFAFFVKGVEDKIHSSVVQKEKLEELLLLSGEREREKVVSIFFFVFCLQFIFPGIIVFSSF